MVGTTSSFVSAPRRAAIPLPAAKGCILLLALAAGMDVSAQTYYWNPSRIGVFEAQKAFNWTGSEDLYGPRNYPPSDRDDAFEDTTLGPWTWVDRDNFDSTDGSGLFTANPGRLTLSSRGVDVWFEDNEFTGIYRTDIMGDFDVSVRVDSQSRSHEWAKAGLMAWNDFADLDKGGGFTVEATPDNGFVVHYDGSAPGGTLDAPNGGTLPMVTFPCWLRMTRQGRTFTGFYRTRLDSPWVQIKQSYMPYNTVAGGSSHIGLFVTSHTPNATTTAIFDDFRGGGNIVPGEWDLRFNGPFRNQAALHDPATLLADLAVRSVDFTGFNNAFSFGSRTLSVSGDITFASTSAIHPGTGRLRLAGNDGQVLTLPPNDTLPMVWKTGTGVAAVAGHPLIADSLRVEAGRFDLGGRNAHLSGFSAGGGLIEGLGADDTLFVHGHADFSGLATWAAPEGRLAIKARGNGKVVDFNPGGKAFRHVTLWTHPTGTNDAGVRIGPGNLNVTDSLVFRHQQAPSLYEGYLDFRHHNPQVTVGGSISQKIDRLESPGSQDLNWHPVYMGDGTWKVGGNVTFSLRGGNADSSVLELTAADSVQLLGVTEGGLRHVKHAAEGALKLIAPLHAHTLSHTAGVLDFNGQDLTLTGDLAVEGGADALAGLAGRTLTVGGKASFRGKEGDSLALAPATSWSIRATDSLTAEYALIGYSDASGGSTGRASRSRDLGHTLNWSFGGDHPTGPPRVTGEPENIVAIVGEAASLSVSAEGSGPLAFAWRKRGDTAVAGRDSVLAFDSVSFADSGFYRCIVTNSSGADTTKEAWLRVIPPPVAPVIVREPRDTLVKAGTPASFSVGVLGTPPLAYKWRRMGDTAVLSTDSLYVIPAATEAMSGSYFQCEVSNASGADTSFQALLTVRNCDSLAVQVIPDTTAPEGAPIRLWSRAVCADRHEWSVISGPAPRLLDPAVDTLNLAAPRVKRDTSIVYRFAAYFGDKEEVRRVTLRIAEAVPDPVFALPAPAAWNGDKPLVIRPAVANREALAGHPQHPLRYAWTLTPLVADTALGGDSLSLRDPFADGILTVGLCMDNGGEAACDTVEVEVKRVPTGLRVRGLELPGGMVLAGSSLHWSAPGRARIVDGRGRVLLDLRGREGTRTEVPEGVLRDLLRARARLEFRP